MDRRRGSESGYSMVELATVTAIISIVMLISVPSILNWWRLNQLRSNARGVASFLKLGRMKAVAGNVSYVADLDPVAAIASRCPQLRTPHLLVVYREVSDVALANPDECFSIGEKVAVRSVAATPEDQVTFRANGMAWRGASAPLGSGRQAAMNWFLVESPNRAHCQLVCVNPGGAVMMNPVTTDCAAPPYGAGSTTPCPPPS